MACKRITLAEYNQLPSGSGSYATEKDCLYDCCSGGACPENYVGSGPVDMNDMERVLCCPDPYFVPVGNGSTMCYDPVNGGTAEGVVVRVCIS